MLEDGKLIDMDIADTIIERPHGFKVNQRQFYLYPVTLGKTYLISRLVECLGINLEIIKANPYMEALRICQEKKESVCRILSYHTINKKEELFDYSLTFGGKSIYGTLIDTACQRYGWTFEYVVWGISYANLQLLLADSVTSIYLSDEERKRVNIPQDRDIINADDPANMAKIKAMKWD